MVGEEGRNVVLVWVGGGDSLRARMAHVRHFFGVGHSRIHLYTFHRGISWLKNADVSVLMWNWKKLLRRTAAASA